MIIFYRGHSRLIFTRDMALWRFFNSKSCLCNSSCISVDFSETFQLLFPWPEEDHILTRSRLTAFYQSYGPLSVLGFLSTVLLVTATPPTFLKGFDETFQLLFPWPYFTKVMLDWFLPELWSYANIIIEKLCQHNILRAAWAWILIVGICLRINVYMTWLTFEQYICPFYCSAL